MFVCDFFFRFFDILGTEYLSRGTARDPFPHISSKKKFSTKIQRSSEIQNLRKYALSKNIILLEIWHLDSTEWVKFGSDTST